jgi:hypothetical protein
MWIALHLEEPTRLPNKVHEVQRKQAIIESKEIVGFRNDAFDRVEETVERLPFRIDLQSTRSSRRAIGRFLGGSGVAILRRLW